jgi:hypothetical protein
MAVVYSLETLGTDKGSIVVVIKNNSPEKKLTIVVTVSCYHNETDNGFRASTEFFEDNNRIEDIKSIVKNKKFWDLIEYYHKTMINIPHKEEQKEKLLDDNRFVTEPERTVTGTTFLREVARSIALKSSSKINRSFDPNFLIAFGSIRQAFSIFTTFKNSNYEEITMARTHTGMSGYVNKYAELTLFDRKLATELSFLHLANVTLANRLILKQTNDIITGIEKVVSYIRRRALPYSLVIAVVHSAAVAVTAYYTGSVSETSLLQSFPDEEGQVWSLVYLVVFPLIWPAAAFLVRTYAPKIFPAIVRYAIKRILNLR